MALRFGLVLGGLSLGLGLGLAGLVPRGLAKAYDGSVSGSGLGLARIRICRGFMAGSQRDWTSLGLGLSLV